MTGITERVSVSSSGDQADSYSWLPVISADGRIVSFYSRAANLVPGDTNGVGDIFIHDRVTGVTERVNVSSDGIQANNAPDQDMNCYPAMSADGRFVVFESYASNLVPNDTNGAPDVFVRDRQTGITERVSVNSDGSQGNGTDSIITSITSDGRYVAYAYYDEAIPGYSMGFTNIFVHDRETGISERVSASSAGIRGNARSAYPSLSTDGRFVSFYSESDNLVPNDTNGVSDIFVHDRATGITERVSASTEGTEGNSYSGGPSSISADGRFVVYSSSADNLVVDDTNGQPDVFVRDRLSQTTKRVSISSKGVQGNASSWGGYPSSISADGRFIAFESDASNLISNDTNGFRDSFIYRSFP